MEQVSRLTDEVLDTLFCEVENQVYGRPITKVSDDVNDLEVLTPNHLLLLRSNTAFPLGRSIDNDIYRCRWREVQYISDLFWKCWSKEYLPQLQVRTKWTMTRRNICVGDLVLLLDENTCTSHSCKRRTRWTCAISALKAYIN